jgi:hypothetical protein
MPVSGSFAPEAAGREAFGQNLQTSSEKVKTFLPASDALRAITIEVLGYSNVGHLGSRHT